jgi:hypothetical protein
MKIKRYLSLALVLMLTLTFPAGSFSAEVNEDFGLIEMLDLLRGELYDQPDDLGLTTVYTGGGGGHMPPIKPLPLKSESANGPSNSTPFMRPAPQPAPQTSPRYFYNTMHAPQSARQGELIKQGRNVNIWMLTTPANASCVPKSDVLAHPTMLNNMVTEFDGIVDRMTADFAPFAGVKAHLPFSNLPSVGDVDGSGKVNVLLYSTPGYNGAFSPNDFFKDFQNTPIALLHLDMSRGNGWNRAIYDPLDYYYTFAHEFQHLLFFTHINAYMLTGDLEEMYDASLWINEALSEAAGQFYTQAGTHIIRLGRIRPAAENSYAGSFYGDLLNFNGSQKNYGMGALHSAFMHKASDGAYVTGFYDYFMDYFPTSTTTYEYLANEAKAKTASISKTLGNAFNHAGMTGSLNADGYTAFSLLYFLFMESFAGDGGRIIGVSDICRTQKSNPYQFSAYNLWGIRPALGSHSVFVSESASSNLSSFASIPSLASGAAISLQGYGGVNPLGASHERLYRLVGTSTANPVLRISVEDNDDRTLYYVVVPNEESGIAAYHRGKLGADVFLLSGDYNIINTHGRPAYLFVCTLFRNVSGVSVGYTWNPPPNYGSLSGYYDTTGICSIDVTLLRRYISASANGNRAEFLAANPRFSEANADINGDGIVNFYDVLLLRRYIAHGKCRTLVPLGTGG